MAAVAQRSGGDKAPLSVCACCDGANDVVAVVNGDRTARLGGAADDRCIVVGQAAVGNKPNARRFIVDDNDIGCRIRGGGIDRHHKRCRRRRWAAAVVDGEGDAV